MIRSIPEVGYNVPKLYFLGNGLGWLKYNTNALRSSYSHYDRIKNKANYFLKEFADLLGVTLVRPEYML